MNNLRLFIAHALWLALPLWFLGTAQSVSAQESLTGHIHYSQSGQPLPGVNIYWLGTNTGTTSNDVGFFELKPILENTPLLISLVGYQTDTLEIGSSRHIMPELTPGTNLAAVEIESSRESASLIQPINQVTIDQHELTRGACCNLSESFETTADVDVEYTDAISGARQLRMLGLDGRYVQLLTENRPGIRGLALPFGLTYIPGTWMNSIQMTKGPGSVVNGYEAMSGQVNVEYAKPDGMEKLNLNVYGSILGRLEANAFGGFKVNDRTTSALFGHAHWVGRQNDHNEDGFLDMPLANMFIAMNRWSFTGRNDFHGQVGGEYVHQDLFGGQLDSKNAGINDLYSNPISVRRGQIWSKVGWISPTRQDLSSGLVLQGTWHEQETRYGNRYDFKGRQRSLYANLINDIPIGGSEQHLLRAGASLQVDDIQEELANLRISDATSLETWTRTEVVPGAFAEYSLNKRDWSVVAGARLDYNNLLGWQGTPRLHLRKTWNEQTTVRVSAGRGLRTVNPVAEFSNWLNSSRDFQRDSGLLWESSWNSGTGLIQLFTLGKRSWSVRLDYYYTAFQNRVIADLDSDPEIVYIRQTGSFSRSHASQAELEGEIAKGLTLKLAYKYDDVRSETAGELRRDVFVPKWRSLFSAGYQTPSKAWQADATLQLVGPSRLPLNFEDSESPVYPQLLAQITRNFNNWSIYLGSENLTNFQQQDAIRGADDPFGSNFDAAGLWGPVMGRNIYTGVKFILR